jgi:SAM-dependent methyltransferase
VLELGIGTGRLALPLAARGLEVHGIDSSDAMVQRLRAKPGGADLSVVLGDFADVATAVDGGFAVVLVAFNTLFNLATEEAQRRCFVNVAARLRPGGSFVVEAFVPDESPGDDGRVTPSVVEADRVVLQVTRRDVDQQTVSGNTVSITERGIRLRPWLIRYAAPAELDAMASAAGLTLAERWSDWHGSAFDGESAQHVTVYRKSPE